MFVGEQTDRLIGCTVRASQQATCSRVGIPNMAAEAAVASSRNVRRIADTWFNTRKQLIYRLHRLQDADNDQHTAG